MAKDSVTLATDFTGVVLKHFGRGGCDWDKSLSVTDDQWVAAAHQFVVMLVGVKGIKFTKQTLQTELKGWRR